MTPTTFVLNPGENRTLSNPVRKIEVTQGSLTVHQGEDKPVVVSADEVYDAHNGGPTSVYAPDGANYAVTHSDEALPVETVASQAVEGAVNAKRTAKKPTASKTSKKTTSKK